MAAPSAPPPVQPRRRRVGGVVWPLVLIFIGAVFLLQNTGYLPSNFWLNLWKLWPLVLVLAGIELLLSHRVPWLALVGLGAVVLVVGAVVANWQTPGQTPPPPPTAMSPVETDLGGASSAAVTVRFGAGQLNVTPLENPNPSELASMAYEGPSNLAPSPRYTSARDGVGLLEYQSSGRGGFPWWGSAQGSGTAHMDLSLAPTVPISVLTIQTGAADAHLDLSTLHVTTMDFSIGAATAWIRFPESAGTSNAHLSGGASTITLEIPPGVAAKIRHSGGLSTFTIDQTRFPAVGQDMYQSPDYDAAQNKLDLTIETGVTTILVN